jgi:Tfp pilus assembly protein FimT
VEEVEPMNTKNQRWRSDSGRSLIEILVVVAIVAILAAVTLPQVISARRLLRSTQLPREVMTHMRNARQQAMSQRQAFTFQYDNVTKQVVIIDHGPNLTGTAVMNAAGYPNTAGSAIVQTVPLTGGPGIPSSELSYGLPPGVSGTAGTLDDTSTFAVLPGTNKVNITFQPDGTVIDGNGIFQNPTLFFYNNKTGQEKETAAAISVLGAAGRVKVWRYNISASKYAE